MRLRAFAVASTATFAATVALVPLGSGAGAGTLSLRVEIPWQGSLTTCPSGHSSTVQCYAHPGASALVRGVGFVSQTFSYPVETQPASPCAPGTFNVLAYPARLTVRGRGEILVSVERATGCLEGPPVDTVLSPTQSFTVTEGSGAFTGATGSGVLSRTRVGRSSLTGSGIGTDLWEGTITAPGFELDLIAPTITGATAKIVRAPRGTKRVRVRYAVRATDNVDASVPVACKPASGSLFKVGSRTPVRCTATDASGNSATVSFAVTVNRSR